MPNGYDKETIEVSARLTLHEFLLEILHYNLFLNAPNPEEALRQFRADLLERMDRDPAVQSPVPAAIVPVLKQRSKEMAENFLLKVAKRLEG